MGFHDPVSSTKEYLMSDDEKREKSSRFSIRRLNYENDEEADADEQEDKNKENINQVKTDTLKEPNDEKIEEKLKVDEKQELQPCIVFEDYDDLNSSQNTKVSTSEISMNQLDENQLTFRNKTELMDYVSKNLPVDDLLKKLNHAEEVSLIRKELFSKVVESIGFDGIISEYFSITDAPNAKLTDKQDSLIADIINILSKLMRSNPNVKHKVLDVFSKNHSEDFLNHALLENSTNAVCQKIGSPNIVNFLIHKANIDDSDENQRLMKKMNSESIRHLIINTHNNNEIVDKKELRELLELLFKNKSLNDVADASKDVISKIMLDYKH